MAFVEIIPVSGSIISRGAIITVRWDTAALPNIIYRPTSGPDEPISVPATAGAKLGSGYTGEYGVDASGPTPIYSIAFKRDAGWTNSGFVISVFDFGTGVDTLSNYTILAEGQYPPDMQPFTDPAEGAGEGTIQVLNSGVLLGSAASINFDDNLVAVLNGDTATIDGEAGGGSSVGSVSGTIGIWSKGNTVIDTFNALTTAQTFDVENGAPFLTTKIRVAATVPLEGINAFPILHNLPPGYISFQDQIDPGVTATTFLLTQAEDANPYADLTVAWVGGEAGAWSTNPYILVFTPKEIPGGVVDFTDLGDVVQSYSGKGGQLVRVNPGESGLEYVAPGTVAGGEEVVGEVWIDGLGNAGVNPGTVGIASVELGEDLGLTAKLIWSTPFADSAYFVQLTQAQVGGPGYNYQVVSGSKLPASAKVAVYDASGTPILLTSTAPAMNFAILAQDGPSAGNTGRGMASFAYTGSAIAGEFTTTGGTLGSDVTELHFGSDDDVGEQVEESMIATQEGDIIWLRARSTQKFLAWTLTSSTSGPGAAYFGLVSVDGGANDLVFGETYDVGFVESGASGSGGDTDLNSVLTVAPINNVVNVPSADPIILRDENVVTTTPLTVSKLATSQTDAAIKAEHRTTGHGIEVHNTQTLQSLNISSSNVEHQGETSAGLTFGGGNYTATVAPGSTTLSGRGSSQDAVDGGLLRIRGGPGGSMGTPGVGGAVTIDAGIATGADNGSILIGEDAPLEIKLFQGFTVEESAAPPLATTGAGKGQFWVNEATSPNKPYFTNEDDEDIDLTAGSGVGDVTSSSVIAANKIVIGDDGAKGVKEAPLGSLSDTGDLTAINTIVTTDDITAGADLIATAALAVGTSAVIATDLTMTAGDVLMSAGATVDGIDVGTAVPANTAHKDAVTGNPHEVEGTEVKSTAEGADSFLNSTAGGVATWLTPAESAALLDHADLGTGIGTNTHAQIDTQLSDVADNSTHRGLTDDNPHGVKFSNLLSETLSALNATVTDATIISTDYAAQTFVQDADPVASAVDGDLWAQTTGTGTVFSGAYFLRIP
jgi:hypothetical protein